MTQITDKKELKRRMDLIGKHFPLFFPDLEYIELNVEDPMFVLTDNNEHIDIIIEWDCEFLLFDVTIESRTGTVFAHARKTDLLNVLK